MKQPRLLIEGLIPRAPNADRRPTYRSPSRPSSPTRRGTYDSAAARRSPPLLPHDHRADRALPVGRLANDDAHLWLWVTNATLFAGQSS